MNFEFASLSRIFREQGFWGTLRKCFLYFSFPFQLFSFRKSKVEKTPAQLVDFAFSVSSGLFKPLQVKWEITHLLERLKKEPPKIILEIGTAIGGNLFLFLSLARRDAKMISLDLPGGQYGGGYPLWRVPFYQMFPQKDQKLRLIRGDSHSAGSLQEVKDKLEGEEIDFLFIDGDHTYEGVKQDFETFSPLVKKGGLVAFHDIAPNQQQPDCGVDKFWAEIKKSIPSEEIVQDSGQRWAGIGLLKMNGAP